MENNVELPISTLKVDFGCTKGCPTDARDMLQQLKGVKSISIDPNEGKIIVVGNVDPMMIIKLFQKMGKKAQLWSFEKEPKKDEEPKKKKSGSHAQHKHDCHDTDDDSETDHGYGHKHRTHHHQRSNNMHEQHNNMFGFGNQHAPPQPVNGYQHAPPPEYQHAPPPMPVPGYNHQPFSGYHNYPPMHRYQPQHMAYPMAPSMYPGSRPMHGYHGPGQPTWPAYGHYGSRFPSYNPMIHYNSYGDNYRYTR
ncbi:Heavy metal transport/detoxification superfamily protein [Trifolium repens]|nr:Heavy metal transport/detoxification superfamily protein [Trifolium repens]